MTYQETTLIGLLSAISCAVIFIHAVCQAARVQHRFRDPALWLWVLLVGGSLWAGVDALRVQPKVQEVMLNVAFAALCGRVAWKIFSGRK